MEEPRRSSAIPAPSEAGAVSRLDSVAMMAVIPRETCFIMLDDNEDELVIAQAYFRRAGLRNRLYLDTAPDKMMRRVQALCENGVDPRDIVVLLDIRMPGMNGFELIYEIRNNIATHAVKIFMLSASRSQADQQDSQEIGADGYIVKPFTIAKLTAALAA